MDKVKAVFTHKVSLTSEMNQFQKLFLEFWVDQKLDAKMKTNDFSHKPSSTKVNYSNESLMEKIKLLVLEREIVWKTHFFTTNDRCFALPVYKDSNARIKTYNLSMEYIYSSFHWDLGEKLQPRILERSEWQRPRNSARIAFVVVPSMWGSQNNMFQLIFFLNWSCTFDVRETSRTKETADEKLKKMFIYLRFIRAFYQIWNFCSF